jgi:hypothetical protein
MTPPTPSVYLFILFLFGEVIHCICLVPIDFKGVYEILNEIILFLLLFSSVVTRAIQNRSIVLLACCDGLDILITELPCHSKCDTIKILLSAKVYISICSPSSSAIVTFPYKQKVLEKEIKF